MKKTEIVVGKTYHNGKEGKAYRERTVIAEGPQFISWINQEDRDCVMYKTVRKGDKSGEWLSEQMTRARFATWAKGIVDVS